MAINIEEINEEEEVTLDKLLSFDNYLDGLEYLYNNLDLSLQVDDYKIDKDTTQERLDYIKESQLVKEKYGFDLSELWDFDHTLFKFILPRLYVFYKQDETLDQQYEEGTFGQIIEAILEACICSVVYYEKDGYRDKINKGMMLLGKYYCRLWN